VTALDAFIVVVGIVVVLAIVLAVLRRNAKDYRNEP
jgi:hypothetical protein